MKRVYQVVQNQPDSNEYNNSTIYLYDNIEAAEECARRLNLEYAQGVILDECGQFLNEDNDADTVHYYTVESIALESICDDEVYDPAKNKTDENSDVYVIVLYHDEAEDGDFAGFYANPEPTLDINAATYYNEETARRVAQCIEDECNYVALPVHYTSDIAADAMKED